MAALSFLYIAIAQHIFSYEPVLRWFDEWLPVQIPEKAFLEGLTEPEANLEGRALVDEIRSAIVDVFAEFGAASNQIGKTYPMLASLNPETRAVLSALKAELDPDELVNPGALGDFSTQRRGRKHSLTARSLRDRRSLTGRRGTARQSTLLGRADPARHPLRGLRARPAHTGSSCNP